MRRDSSSGHILLVRQPFPEVRGGHLALKRLSKGPGRVEGKPRQKPGGQETNVKEPPPPTKEEPSTQGNILKCLLAGMDRAHEASVSPKLTEKLGSCAGFEAVSATGPV